MHPIAAPLVALRVLLAAASAGGGASTTYVDWIDALAGASDALSSGRAGDAEALARVAVLARPEGAAGARARLALGTALLRQRRAGPAATELATAAAALPDTILIAHARIGEAEARLAAGAPADAATLFGVVARTAPEPLARATRWREAAALRAAGDLRRASAAYQALLQEVPADPRAPAARLALASLQRALGDEASAAAAYRSLWLERPGEPAGREAGRELAAWSRAGGPIPSPTAAEQLARVEKLVLAARPRRALVALDRVGATLTPPDDARAALLRAWALLQLARPADAEAAARCALGEPAADAGTHVGARLVLARAAARAGRVDEAIRAYESLATARPAAIPGLGSAAARDLPAEAGYLAARLLLDAGRHAAAAAALRRHALENPRSHRALDARWFEAWALYRLGRAADARRAFERLETSSLAPGALYWRARLEPASRARALYRRAIAADPGGWYSLLAAARLASLGERAAPLTPRAAVAIGDGPGAGATGDALARASVLLGAGLREQALAELRAVASSPRARPVAAAAAQLAAAAADPELPLLLARDHLATTHRSLRWLHPDAFPERLPALAAATGVDRFLVLALLRRESVFRPDARSSAGAVGLSQLLPQTAERVATVLGVPATKATRLADPEVNLALGVAYVALLHDRFRDPAVELAAYNAGPSVAASWAKERAGRPLDEWVEEIPFRETRRYVKTVLAAHAVYRWLYAGDRLAIDPTRPVHAPRRGVAF